MRHRMDCLADDILGMKQRDACKITRAAVARGGRVDIETIGNKTPCHMKKKTL